MTNLALANYEKIHQVNSAKLTTQKSFFESDHALNAEQFLHGDQVKLDFESLAQIAREY